MEYDIKSANYSKTLKFSKSRIIKNLAVISSSFLMHFTAYNGLSMLQSTMNKEGGMGLMSQAATYIGFMTASLLITKYCLKKLGCKTSLTIAVFLYVPYVAANFYPVWGTLVSSALLAGIGASLLWGAQATYFNISAFLYCTASQGVVIEDPNDNSIVPSNCTSVEELSVKDIACNINKNVSCTKILSKIEDTLHSTGPKITFSHTLNAIPIKNVLEDPEAVTYIRRRSSWYEHGFFPPKEFLDDLRSNISSFQHNVPNNYGPSENGQIDLVVPVEKSFPTHKSPETQTRIEILTPLLFGLHGLLYHSSMIWSSIMSYYILQNDDRFSNITASSNSNFSCACGAAYCNGLSSCSDELIAVPTPSMRHLLTGISIALDFLAFILVALFVDQLGTDKEPVKFSLDVMMATFKHGKKIEQILLVPMAIYVGMVQGFYVGDYTKSYIACALGTFNVGRVTIFYGITCAFSTTLAGWLVRHIGRIPIFIIGEIINVGTNVYLLMWSPNPNEPYMFFLGALLWGLFTGIFWSQLPAFNGLLFKGEEEAAFAFYYLCLSMGYTITFICSDLICTHFKIYILLAVSSLGVIGYLFTERLYSKRKSV